MNSIFKSTKKIQITKATILFVLAIVFFATTLRTPITGVGPIISYIRDGLGISNVLAGSLTTIPLLAFAVISPFAPKIARKFGIEVTLFASVVLITLGIIIRSLGNTPSLLFGTIFIGIGIAFGNVLIPSFFKLKYPLHIGLLTAIYTVSMNISAGISIGISQPITENTPFGWQGALAVPIVLTIITLLVWVCLLRGEKLNSGTMNRTGAKNSDINLWKSPLAWAITLAMGLQSIIFYCSTAWLPEILISQGFSAESAGWMTALMQYSQIPMTFLTPILAEKFAQRPLVFVFTFFYLVGFSGLLNEWTNYVALWMICIGLAGGSSFSLALMFFTLRTKTAYEAAQISGFAQSLGYLFAAVGPILFGYLYDSTGEWLIPNIILIITAIFLFFTAFISAKERYII